jgi:hypothetical protein
MQPNTKNVQVTLEGPVGEYTPLFTLPIKEAKEVRVDMTKTTYINSVGVKHWILWTSRIPRDCEVKLFNCPFVIVSQANIVMGFLVPQIKVESFRAPFVCEDCNYEEIRTLSRGQEYEYATPMIPAKLNLPEHFNCPKCKKDSVEPDFMPEKAFKFLG